MTGFFLYTELNNDNAIDNNSVVVIGVQNLLETFSLYRM